MWFDSEGRPGHLGAHMDPHYSYEYDGQRVVDPMSMNGGYDYDTTIECRENGVLCGVMMHGRG